MSLYPPPAGAAAEYKKALELYETGDTIGATCQAVKNLNDAYCPRYVQIKNLLMIGTLIEDEGHALNHLTLAEVICKTLAEDVDTRSEQAQQMMEDLRFEIEVANRRREGTDGPLPLSSKAREVLDHSVLGLAPELDISMGLRDYIKQIMASRIAAEKEAINLRLEISRLAKNQSEATRQLAVLHVQNSQVSSQKRRLGAYGGFMLNLIVVCCGFVFLFFFGWNRSI